MNAAAYWQSRALKFGDVDRGLPAICSYGMPRLYNEAIDACQRRALKPWLDACRELDVLEVGCGVGRWSLELANRGNRVTGIDISPRMVELAAANAASGDVQGEFLVGDVVSLDLGRRFDFILAVTVLQHVVEDDGLKKAVGNLAAHLREHGTIVLLEVAPGRLIDRCDTVTFRTRPLSHYERLLEDAGLEIIDVRGVDIAPLRPFLLPAMRRMPPKLARWLVTASTLLSLPIDLALSRYVPRACWHQLIAARFR